MAPAQRATMDQAQASPPHRILDATVCMLNIESIQIRQGRGSDAPALAAFAARTFEETFGADNRPADMQEHLSRAFGIAQQTRELLDPNMTTLLTHQGEVLVAFAQVQRKAPPPSVIAARPIELHRFYVDRPAHGKGIAHLLMHAVHHAARSANRSRHDCTDQAQFGALEYPARAMRRRPPARGDLRLNCQKWEWVGSS